MLWSHRTVTKSTGVGGPMERLGPDSVQTWLSALADEEPSERTDRLTQLLEKLRAGPLSPEERYRAVENCRRETTRLKRELDRSLAGLTLPLPVEKEQFSRKCAETHRLLAECYKNLAIGAAEDPVRMNAACLMECCYWGIASLGEYLLINYERYLKVRQGIWQEVHQFYGIARSEGMHDIPLDEHARPRQTVEHIYKRVLLLGLSNPFRHPFRGQTQAYARLDRWATLTELATTPPNSRRCLFTVDPSLDRPALPVLSHKRARPHFNEFWLNTLQLVSYLKRRHDKAIDQAVRQLGDPGNVTEELDSIEMLRRMIVNWGIHPIRSDSRTRTYKTCDVVVGLKAVCLALNSFEPLAGQERMGPSAALTNMLRGRFDPESVTRTDAPEISTQWEIADESRRGLRMVCGDCTTPPNISIGEVVAVRTQRSPQWSVGIVNWAQTSEDNRLSMGLEVIPVPAQPVSIFRLQTDGPPARTRNEALLLIHEAENKRTVSLLCHKSVYYPTAIYLLRIPKGQGERVVEATNVRLSTRSLVWFEVSKPRADTKEKTLDLIYPY
jgi:hypothetical protein